MLSRRTIGFLVFASLVVAGCARLGFWQLDRLSARRAANTELQGRIGGPTVDVAELLRDTAALALRPTRMAGRYDYDNGLVLGSRSRQGSPGVHLITPFIRHDSDTAVLVNRGWVYSPDGMTVTDSLWREPESLGSLVIGHADRLVRTAGGSVFSLTPRVVRRLAYDSIAPQFPYPIAPAIVAQEVVDAGAQGAITHPVRLDPPRLSEGSHLSYAIQWFSFALIGVAGMVAVVRRDRRSGEVSRGGGPVARG
ncbi:MAG: SURF1 family protein [Gemmatimonadota bacterium]